MRPVCVVITATIVAAIAIGCDGYIHVRGRVYASDGGTGMVALDRDATAPPDGYRPLEGVAVMLVHDPRCTKSDADAVAAAHDAKGLWVDRTTTDRMGSFDVGGVTAPSRFQAALLFEKDGYQRLVRLFTHQSPERHRAMVAMVPEKR